MPFLSSGNTVRDKRITFLDSEATLGGAFLHPGARPATERLLDFLTPQPGQHVLEMGCGTGTTTVLLASRPSVSIVSVDASPAMLRTAQARVQQAGCSSAVRFIHHDLNEPLPLPDESADAVFAESVIALLDPEPVLREAWRVLRPGGKLALNERIWQLDMSQSEVERVNALSRAEFGIPAATPTPLDREGWIAMLGHIGFHIDEVVPVDSLSTISGAEPALSTRLARYRRYLNYPHLAWHQLRFKRAIRRHRTSFDTLESYLFFAHKPLPNRG